MDRERLNWRSFSDTGTPGAGAIATQWNLSATPTFYVIDPKGVIRYKWAGAPGEEVLDAALGKLIKAAEACEDSGLPRRTTTATEPFRLSFRVEGMHRLYYPTL